MIYSMTGFGRCQASCEGAGISMEIQSVNRRNLEISVNLPREWQSLERDVQAALRSRFNRGKLHVTVQATSAAGAGGFVWDEAALESSLKRLEEVAARLGASWSPDSEALVRLAALNRVEAILPDPDAVRGLMEEIVSKAAAALLDMRKAEGAALESDLLERVRHLKTAVRKIREGTSGTVPHYREMLFQRLSQAGLELELSDERVLKEIAIFADRCDVTEELTRLESHLKQMRECIGEGSPVGRKLEFIVQELNREFNTVGAKANDIGVSRVVIEAKNEIERIREQIQNVE